MITKLPSAFAQVGCIKLPVLGVFGNGFTIIVPVAAAGGQPPVVVTV